ncbi:MAG: TPM domain-containing protein [Actinobacteria bacterium]|nr:TPM domain-containing protein [Actinomycetota bacterium]
MTAKEKISDSNLKPKPETDKKHIVFNDLKKGEIRHGHFILKNSGGPYKNLDIFVSAANSFLKITEKLPLNSEASTQMPLKIFFEAKAEDWSRKYSDSIIIRLDDEEVKVAVELNTQTRPVNDFAHIIDPYYTRKIEYIIKKLEKKTSAEIAVVTIESLEGKTIEKYANELFNDWKIGKEDKHNGILFLIDTCENKYRIEVGLGLENLITPEFIHRLFDTVVLPNFKSGEFGIGIYRTLHKIAEKIYQHQRASGK